jgi:hypothetical protein
VSRAVLLWCAAALLGGALFGASQIAPVEAAPVVIVSSGTSYTGPPLTERERFAMDLLAQIENTQPTQETIDFLVEWTIAEDGSGGALVRNNPLNTTMCGFNMTGAINGDGACGVQGYATYEDGLAATVATLTQSNFMSITIALQQNDAPGALQALITSDWAESKYGGGADWPHGARG